MNVRGLFLPFGASAGNLPVRAFSSPLLGALRLGLEGAALSALEGAWHAVWAVAVACAIRAIRDPRALLAALCAAVVVVVTLALRGWT